MTPVLMDDTLFLRPLEHEDARAYAAIINAPGVAQSICGEPVPFSVHHAAARILMRRAAEMTQTGYGWAIEDGSGIMVGLVTLDIQRQPSSTNAQLGFVIHPDFRGRNYAVIALTQVLGWIQSCQIAHTITTEVGQDNAAALHVLGNLGFVRAGASTRFSLATHENVATQKLRLPIATLSAAPNAVLS